MPKVLTKLRIDEISAVDRAAGEGTRVVLMKRDVPSFYHRLFAGDVRVRKATYRGAQGHWLRNIPDLSREEAKHFLLHDAHGRALLRDTGVDIDTLADHLVEASLRPTEKREVSNMQSFTKAIADLGEHGYTQLIQKFASNNRLSNETAAQAFVRIFSEDSAQGLAIRKAWLLSKGQSIAVEPRDDRDDTDDAGASALQKLEALGAELRKRNPTLTKEQAFAKAYSDPANAKLVRTERAQHRPRA
jgi:hypothetical protein